MIFLPACAPEHSPVSLKVELSRISLEIPDLPADFENYRIAFLSDIHLGRSLPFSVLTEALQIVSKAQPNLLLLGGDYLWIPKSPLEKTIKVVRNEVIENFSQEAQTEAEIERYIYRLLARELSLLDIPDGIYGVMGNHDNWADPLIAQQELSQAGVKILVNSEAVITRGEGLLSIYGSDDYWTGIPEAPSWKNHNSQTVRCLLTHNPDFLSQFFDSSSCPFHFALAGHTHGGQIRLPILGALTYNIKDLRFKSGLATINQKHVFTTRGIGFVELPWRLNCPPEVALITLKRAENSG
jgi:predicted MPP superfamily phosphohydrolase